MIFKYSVTFLLSVYAFFISLLPDQSQADINNVVSMNNAINGIQDFVESANFWFPVDDLFTIVKLMFAIYVLIGLFMLARFIAHIITAGLVK